MEYARKACAIIVNPEYRRTGMKYLFWLILLCVTMGCTNRKAVQNIEGSAPPLLIGNYEDDYGIRHTIGENLWYQHPDSRYRIVHWFPEAQYLIAQNDESNASDGGLWTRIDWLELSGMPPYAWAFCISAYNAPSAEDAIGVNIAQRETPETGCNGYPFSRMQQTMNRRNDE